jgi:hypothetical protein
MAAGSERVRGDGDRAGGHRLSIRGVPEQLGRRIAHIPHA